MFGSQITDVESSAESNNVLRYQFHDALRRQTPKRCYDQKFSKLPSTIVRSPRTPLSDQIDPIWGQLEFRPKYFARTGSLKITDTQVFQNLTMKMTR